MSPKTTSTSAALAAILALSGTPLLAQTAADTTEAPAANAAEAASDAAADAMNAANQAADAAKDAAATTGDAAEAAVDAATEAASNAAAAAGDAAKAANDATADTMTPAAKDAAETPVTATDGAADNADSANEATATSADAPAASGTDDGAAPAAPPVGGYYTRSTQGDWTLRCVKTADGIDPCELYQLLKDGEGNSVAEVTLIPLENGGEAVAGATIVAPLETDLTKGLALRVDNGSLKAYPFNFCAPIGCVSRVGLSAEELASLKRGKAANLSLLPYGAGEDQVVSLDLPLTGFTAAYTELEAVVAELRKAAEAEKAKAEATKPAVKPATKAAPAQ